MFDKVEVVVRSGDGGDGAVSFRREKYVPFGGPDGGDGGDGGNVVAMADTRVESLRIYKPKKIYRAGKGEDGGGNKKSGKNGKDLVLSVPVGTIVIDNRRESYGELIADCAQPEQRVILARGGRGGLGNTHFASSTNQAPRIAQKGEAGEELSLMLEMRLIADVGVIGFPNAGKSTLLVAASAAKPKIASYPFTTLEPVLGVVEVGLKSFVVAEIPGLIDGAHLGRGLGHDFLRHIMRTKILIHLIDGNSVSPVEDMTRLNVELGLFDATLVRKAQLVVINKIDLPQVQARLSDLKQAFEEVGTRVLFISAARGDGIGKLMAEALEMLAQTRVETVVSNEVKKKVFRPRPRGAVPIVRREGEIFIIGAPELERIVSRVDMTNPEVRRQVQGQLGRLGMDKALQKAGVKPGDKVRCGDFEWYW